jgi:hypothetical protein
LRGYSNVVFKGVDDNPEQLKEDELNQARWPIIELLLDKQVETGIERFGDLSAHGCTSTDLHKLLPAAKQGWVDTLLVDGARCIWGNFYPDSDQVHIHGQPKTGDEDLLNLAIIHVLIGRGEVYTSSEKQMPDRAAQAAIFRY